MPLRLFFDFFQAGLAVIPDHAKKKELSPHNGRTMVLVTVTPGQMPKIILHMFLSRQNHSCKARQNLAKRFYVLLIVGCKRNLFDDNQWS